FRPCPPWVCERGRKLPETLTLAVLGNSVRLVCSVWHSSRSTRDAGGMKFCGYETGGFFDEMFGEDGRPRAAARPLARNIESLPEGELVNRQQAADLALVQMGITFNVYGESAGLEKTLPFDLVPRIVPAAEWDRIERGLKQRIRALNLFIDDLYHERKVIRDGLVPEYVIASSQGFRPQCAGLSPPRGV